MHVWPLLGRLGLPQVLLMRGAFLPQKSDLEPLGQPKITQRGGYGLKTLPITVYAWAPLISNILTPSGAISASKLVQCHQQWGCGGCFRVKTLISREPEEGPNDPKVVKHVSTPLYCIEFWLTVRSKCKKVDFKVSFETIKWSPICRPLEQEPPREEQFPLNFLRKAKQIHQCELVRNILHISDIYYMI